MNDREKDDRIDELLDSALAQYSSAEPRPGLETRILARLREAGASAQLPGRSWRWLWAGAMAAFAVLLFVLFTARHSQVAAPQNNVARSPESPGQVTIPPTQSGAPAIATGAATHRRRLRERRQTPAITVKLDQRLPVFPAPTPLSEQERLLLSYYTRTPREELIAQSRPDEPPAVSDDQSNVVGPEPIFVPQKSSNTR